MTSYIERYFHQSIHFLIAIAVQYRPIEEFVQTDLNMVSTCSQSWTEMDARILSTGDIDRVLTAVKTIPGKWRKLGEQLGITPTSLETIADKFRYPKERLQATLEGWLKGGSGRDPTWSSLVDALNRMGERQLAGKVEKKHCILAKEAVKDSAAPSKVHAKPTLPELYPIPVANSNWRSLGLALGLNQQQLTAIELTQNTDHKRKRSIFKQWLGIDSAPSWKTVIRALEEINENEVAEKVRLEYNISTDNRSSKSSPTRSLEQTDCGTSDSVLFSPTNEAAAKSLTVPSPTRTILSESAEYRAMVECYDDLIAMLTGAIDVLASKLFEGAILTTEAYQYAANMQATPRDRASRLADEILHKVHTNPRVFFGIIVDILKGTSGHATHIQDTAKLYQIFLELQRLPAEARNWDVSNLAWRLVNSKLVATSTYQELTVKQTEAEKVRLLRDQLSARGLSQPFLQILDVLPALRAHLPVTSSDAAVLTAAKTPQSKTNRDGSAARKGGKGYVASGGSSGSTRPERVSAPIEEHLDQNESRSELLGGTDSVRRRPVTELHVQKFPAQLPHFTGTPFEAHQKVPPDKAWETPAVAASATNKHRASTAERDGVRGKSSKSSKKGRKSSRDGPQKKTTEETTEAKTEVLSHKGRTVAMATTDSHGDPVAMETTDGQGDPVAKDGIVTSKGVPYSPKQGSQAISPGQLQAESQSEPGSGLASERQQESLGHGSLDLGHGGEGKSDSIPKQRHLYTEQIMLRKQRVSADSSSTSSSGSYHSTTDMVLRPSSPLSPHTSPAQQHWPLEHPSIETKPQGIPAPATSETQPLAVPSPTTSGIQPLGTPSLAPRKAQPQAVPSQERTDLSLSGRTSATSTPSGSLPSFSTQSTSLASSTERDSYMAQYRDAVVKGDTSTVELLLKKEKFDVDTPLKDGSTALMLAASDGHAGLIRELLKHKASVHLTDRVGATALHLAASHGNYEAVKLLVEALADVNSITKDRTPVLLPPASKGFSIIVEYLLQNGASANKVDKDGNTALIAAASRGQKDVVKVLLQRGADVNAVGRETSRTALQEAVKGDFTDIIIMLAKAAADTSEKSHSLFTCKTAEVVRRLIGEGAKVGDRRGDDATPLMIQVERGNREVVEELIRAGASVDSQDEDGRTALMRAVSSGSTEMVQTIITAGPITDLRDKNGQSALMLAVRRGHTGIAKQLVMAGADPNLRDKNGQSPAELAQEHGSKEMAGIFERQTDSKDPFLNLLSGYLKKMSNKEPSDEPAKKAEASPKQQKKPASGARKLGGAFSRDSTPKESVETSTLRDQLNKAWRRIADLETRIHDLTLQSTMELSDTTDLTYLDRGRMETEYRKLKELKRKSEQYAIEAKQTAQRLSAENFKLKEDLSRERHHNELTRKNMLREMEQKLDKQATAEDRADAKMEVLEQELTERARQIAMRMAPAQASHLPRVEFKPSQVRELLLRHRVRASVVQVGVGGMPYCGKSTLVCNMLELGSTSLQTQRDHARIRLEAENGLSVYEAVMMKDRVNGKCLWLHSSKEDAEVLVVAAALAQVCAKSQQFPTFSGSQDKKTSEAGSKFGDHDVEEGFGRIFESLRKLMVRFEQKGQINHLVNTSLTFMSVMDVGVNKTVYEIMTILAARCKNTLLLSFVNLERDTERLYEIPNLEDGALYRGQYSARNDDKTLMKLQTTLHYSARLLLVNGGHDSAANTALLVGSHADRLSKSQVKGAKRKILQSVNGKAEEIGVGEVVHGVLTVDARKKEDALRVRTALEELIERGNRFERDIPLTWLFLRYILFMTKKLTMSRAEVSSLGKKCGIMSEDELEEWLLMFQSSGSIIYSPSTDLPLLHDYVVLEPVRLIQDLDRLYYVREQQDGSTGGMEGHVERTESGFLSYELAKHLWSDHCGFYLKLLQNLGIIVQVDDILEEACPDSSQCFFMPSLRPYHSRELPSATSTSLLVVFNTELPYHKQSDFVVYLKQHFNRRIRFVPKSFYNFLHFKWVGHDGTKIADINIRFLGELVEISVEMAPEHRRGGFEDPRSEICSVLKTACVEVFHNATQELPGLRFDLAIVCPSCAEPSGSGEHKIHYLTFHPLQDSKELFCEQCQREVPTDGEGALWVLAAYQGPTSLALDPEDLLSVTEVTELAQELSDLSLQDVSTLGTSLGYSVTEIEARILEIPAEDVLFVLLVEWVRRRRPLRARKVLAQALIECKQYALAIKLDPSRL